MFNLHDRGRQMIRRTIEAILREVAGQYPVMPLTGPRQSGNTTLVRAIFKDHEYASLEEPRGPGFCSGEPAGVPRAVLRSRSAG